MADSYGVKVDDVPYSAWLEFDTKSEGISYIERFADCRAFKLSNFTLYEIKEIPLEVHNQISTIREKKS